MSYKVKKVYKIPADEVIHRCVGCGSTVTPGMCYTGSVIGSLIFKIIPGEITRTPIEVIHEWPNPFFTVTGGGEVIKEERTIGFYKRTKGLICDGCAGNYHTVTDARGNRHPIVITDPRPGYLGVSMEASQGHERGFKRGPAFNTRYTQGRTGRRV